MDPLQAELIQATKAQATALHELTLAVQALTNALGVKLERIASAQESIEVKTPEVTPKLP